MPTDSLSQNELIQIFLPVALSAGSELDYKSLLIQQAQRIGLSASKQPYLALSGGLDSEAMALAFIEGGVQFKAAIMRYNDNLNYHDISEAIEFCRLHKIEYKFFDLDVISFLESGEYFNYAKNYDCISPQMAAHLWLREQTDTVIVFAGQTLRFQINPSIKSILRNEPVIFAQKFHEHLSLVEALTTNEFLVKKVSEGRTDQGYTNFLCKTPELRAALLLLENPIERFKKVQQLCVENPVSDFGNVRYFQEKFIMAITKFDFFRQAGFQVNPKPMKFTGFERVHTYYGLESGERSQYLKALREGTSHSFNSAYSSQFKGLTNFNRLFREPMTSHVLHPKEIVLEFSADFLEALRLKVLTDWKPSLGFLFDLLLQQGNAIRNKT